MVLSIVTETRAVESAVPEALVLFLQLWLIEISLLFISATQQVSASDVSLLISTAQRQCMTAFLPLEHRKTYAIWEMPVSLHSLAPGHLHCTMEFHFPFANLLLSALRTACGETFPQGL